MKDTSLDFPAAMARPARSPVPVHHSGLAAGRGAGVRASNPGLCAVRRRGVGAAGCGRGGCFRAAAHLQVFVGTPGRYHPDVQKVVLDFGRGQLAGAGGDEPAAAHRSQPAAAHAGHLRLPFLHHLLGDGRRRADGLRGARRAARPRRRLFPDWQPGRHGHWRGPGAAAGPAAAHARRGGHCVGGTVPGVLPGAGRLPRPDYYHPRRANQ